MPNMHRKQIYIDPRQDRQLKQKASRLHVTESELIREGIEKVLLEGPAISRDVNAWGEEKSFLSSLMKKGPVKGSRSWKREDLYDRKISR